LGKNRASDCALTDDIGMRAVRIRDDKKRMEMGDLESI
jgi:hypothetical protein